jgi:hypothetical protein
MHDRRRRAGRAGRGGRAEGREGRSGGTRSGTRSPLDRRAQRRGGRARCTIDDDEQGEQGGAVGRKAERQRENGAAAARPRAERASGLGNGDSGSAVGDRVSRLGLCRESSVGPALLAEGFGPFN